LRKLCGFVALCNDVMSYLVFPHLLLDFVQ
jgi:hypothetical protein